MAADYAGSCRCGAVTGAIEGEALWVRQCWCRQCQKVAGGGATTNALFARAAISTKGALTWSAYTAASGNVVRQAFCASCGTPVLVHNDGRPDLAGVRVGFLDDAADLVPMAAIWMDEAPRWAVVPDGLDRFPGQPPLPTRG